MMRHSSSRELAGPALLLRPRNADAASRWPASKIHAAGRPLDRSLVGERIFDAYAKLECSSFREREREREREPARKGDVCAVPLAEGKRMKFYLRDRRNRDYSLEHLRSTKGRKGSLGDFGENAGIRNALGEPIEMRIYGNV